MSNRAAFTIVHPQEVASLVRDAGNLHASVAWSDSAGHSGMGMLFAHADQVRLETAGVASGEVRLAFSVHDVPLFAQCSLDACGALSPLEMWSSDYRGATRVAAQTDAELVWVVVRDGEVESHRSELLDLGVTGARSLHAHGAPRPHGTVAATIRSGSEQIPCLIHVCSERSTARGVELGLRVDAAGSGALAEFVLRGAFPQVQLRRHVAREKLVQLMNRSGYMHLREGCAIDAAWFEVNEDSVTRDLVYVARDGEAIAHGSVTRAYSSAWLGHQTAMVSRHSEAASARRLLSTMTMVTSLLDGPRGRSIAYYDQSKPYGRIFFDEFAKSVRQTDLAVVAELDWFERSSSPLTHDGEIPLHLRVCTAEPQDLAFVAAMARAQLPAMVCESLDLHPGALRSDAMHPGYVGSSLSRTREVFVVRDGQRILGAALCERTTRSLSLFNTLNMALFLFVEGATDEAAHRALQQHVRHYYEGYGIADPFVVAPPGTFLATLDPHTTLAQTIGCITWSFEGLRAYENYLKLRCAWLEQGKRPRLRPRPKQTTHGRVLVDTRSSQELEAR